MEDDLFDGEEAEQPVPPHKSTRSQSDIEASEQQIKQNIKDVRYIIREYPVEVVVLKYLKGRDKDENEIYVPDYQRDLIWPERHKSRFIESMLIGLPIPFLFVADVNDDEDPTRTVESRSWTASSASARSLSSSPTISSSASLRVSAPSTASGSEIASVGSVVRPCD
jgi:Protein of unknown function DUF262